MILKKVNTLKLNDPGYPDALKVVSPVPKKLFWTGVDPAFWLDEPKVAIVGSRKISAYGKEVTKLFASELAHAGVVIISGLAFGVDASAHLATVEAGGKAVAVLPTPLERISPVSNQQLAHRIIENGGTLISEYPIGAEVHVSNFVARNRIVSGLCDVLLITEAAVNSGSLHTARFALEQGKTVMVVPGNITSPTSEGCNNLIKSGAIPATTADDIFFALNIKPKEGRVSKTFKGSKQEQQVLELISTGISDQEEIAIVAKLDTPTVNSTLTMLEIEGFIRPHGAGKWSIS